MTPEYKSAKDRVKKADTIEKLEKLETSLGNIYSLGFLTTKELGNLYTTIFEKIVKIETESEGL